MNEVLIKAISWSGDIGEGADVLFKLNNKQFWAYCYPCVLEENKKANVFIEALYEDIDDIHFWTMNKNKLRLLEQSNLTKTRYYGYGQIKSINPVLIDVGDFCLNYGEWTNDKNVIGIYVYFVIASLRIVTPPHINVA